MTHYGPISHSLYEYFIARVRFKLKDESCCWNWTGGHDLGGYGTITPVKYNNKIGRAHRVAWELEYRSIPEGMFVCHHCDNPQCVRPSHLFLGTTADNTADMIAKGRKRKMCSRGTVLEIRNRYSAGESIHKLAIRFKLTRTSIYKIVTH